MAGPGQQRSSLTFETQWIKYMTGIRGLLFQCFRSTQSPRNSRQREPSPWGTSPWPLDEKGSRTGALHVALLMRTGMPTVKTTEIPSCDKRTRNARKHTGASLTRLKEGAGALLETYIAVHRSHLYPQSVLERLNFQISRVSPSCSL